MPRVHFVKAARKDNPAVNAGESYYWWKFRHGGKRYSRTRPRPSQLTQSDKLSRAYGLSERIEDMASQAASQDQALSDLLEVVADELEAVAGEVRELADEYRESAQAIRDNFTDSPTADDCDEKADALEGWADEIEDAARTLADIEGDAESACDELEHAMGQADGCPI